MIHRFLCKPVQGHQTTSGEGPNGNVGPTPELVGHSLPSVGLPFFLKECHDSFASVEINQDYARREIARILKSTNNYAHLGAPWSMPAAPVTNSDGLPVPPGSTSGAEGAPESSAAPIPAIRRVLKGAVDVCQAIVENHSKAMKSIAEQHGTLLKDASLSKLAAKARKEIDTSELELLYQQITCLHEGQYFAHCTSPSSESAYGLIIKALNTVEHRLGGIEKHGLCTHLGMTRKHFRARAALIISYYTYHASRVSLRYLAIILGPEQSTGVRGYCFKIGSLVSSVWMYTHGSLSDYSPPPGLFSRLEIALCN